MPLLIPVIVGVSAFLLGIGAGTVARGDDGVSFDLDDAQGKRMDVVLKSGGRREGEFAQLHDEWLTLNVGEGELHNIPLKNVKQVYVYC